MEGDQRASLEDPSELHQNLQPSGSLTVSLNSPMRNPSGDMKALAVRNIIEKDPRAADFKWSLFVAACQSYRYDSCLRPFPPQYVKNDVKDIDSLRDVVDQTPTFPVVLEHLKDPDVHQPSKQVIDLLHWVLVHLKDGRLKSVPTEEFDTVLSRVQSEVSAQPPNYIFHVQPNPKSSSQEKWLSLQRGRTTIFAFHGSRLENFHSIIHVGLQQHLNKNSLFGQGVYLSSELSVSLPYSPTGYGWGRSLLGSELSCVALCEMINHPDVKCQHPDPARAIVEPDSIGGKVPKKYYVVTNSDVLRLRYLLVYGRQPRYCLEDNSFVGWVSRHKLLTFIVGYVVLLASIGLSNNECVRRYYRIMLKKAGF